MYVVVLANNTREAMRYAAAAKLPRGSFRYAAKASTIRRLRVAEVHILPEFHKRLDRHAILAELRYAKATYVEISAEQYRQLTEAYPLERAATIAARYLAISNALDTEEEAPSGEEARAPEPSEDPAPAEKVESPAVKRKTRAPKPPAAAKPVVADTDGFF